jgi:hypothetical protein
MPSILIGTPAFQNPGKPTLEGELNIDLISITPIYQFPPTIPTSTPAKPQAEQRTGKSRKPWKPAADHPWRRSSAIKETK